MIYLIRFSIFFIFFMTGIISAQNDPTVYVTKTGSKYHSAGCSFLGKSSIPKKLSEVGNSYSPCSRCKPPALKTADIKSEQTHDDAKSSTKTSEVNTSETPTKTNDKKTVQSTPSGKTIYEGPRGGHYYYSKSGKKVYVKKKH